MATLNLCGVEITVAHDEQIQESVIFRTIWAELKGHHQAVDPR